VGTGYISKIWTLRCTAPVRWRGAF